MIVVAVVLLLLLLFDDDTDDEYTDAESDNACRCNVNAKLYITIIRNLERIQMNAMIIHQRHHHRYRHRWYSSLLWLMLIWMVNFRVG